MRRTRLSTLIILAFLLSGAKIAAAAAPAPTPEPRLGDAVAPTFEAVRLRLDPAQSDYSGSVAVDLQVRKPTDRFRFHARGQQLGRIALTRDGKDVPFGVDRSGTETTVVAAAPLAPGAYRLEIDFTQAFDTHSVALYRTEFAGRAYAFTQFEAADARGAFPCWDEPGFKIPWQLTLEVPAGLLALSNTPIESESPATAGGEGGWKTLVFARTPPLPSYLLAVAVGPFETVPIPGLSVPGRVVTAAGQSGLAGLAAAEAPALLKSLERYFGRPYPFAKLDLIAVPEFWPGAMENPGAITFADRILLADPKSVTAEERLNVSYVTAHEMAHMWFGDLVTMAWWDDFWLNEAFADWMAGKVIEEVHPELKVQLRELQDVQRQMGNDASPTSRAIRQPVADPSAMLESAGLAYDKGKAVLGMFETWMGPEAFRRGVNDYLTARSWGNSVAADLWSALGRASGRNVEAVMAGFVDQPGLPLVEVAVRDGGRLHLTQRRFLTQGATAPPLAWSIPVGLKVLVGGKIETLHTLLTAGGVDVDVPGVGPDTPIDWVMPNLGAAGYYRWTVPAAMLPALSRGAAAHLGARERVSLIGNLGALLDAGLLPGDRYLASLSELADDPEPAVLAALISGIDHVRPLIPPDLEEAFAAYVRRTLTPALDRFGLDPRPGEDQAVTLFRPDLLEKLGGEGRDQAVLEHAAQLAQKAMADPTAVDPSLVHVALELAAEGGDRQLFDAMRRRFEAAKVPGERGDYLSALGHFRDPALAGEALRYALSGPLHPNEVMRMGMGIGRTEAGSDLVLDWVVANYDRIAATVPPVTLPFLPRIGNGCSEKRLAAAKEFFAKPGHTVPGTASQLARVTDEVNACLELKRREGSAIGGYLRRMEGTDNSAGKR